MAKAKSPLQGELKQTVPFHSLSQEAAIGLLRTADWVRRKMAEALEPAGVTPQQYNVLRILRGAGEEPLPTLEIGSRMIEQAPGITRLLDRLEAKGLVERERCLEDRRRVLCRISKTGRELLASLDQRIAATEDATLAGLSEEQQQRLVELLDAIRAALMRV
ncbi:MAG TPA: MarR family transcriptional regulator [Thermoanaerobaculia bacterium]|nr:MarR family transcriptional regulator [Thermoanaerobaculia bacterium]